MTDVGIVWGSEEQAQPVIINDGTVYVHKDIKRVERNSERDGDMRRLDDESPLYEYHEYLYTMEEYIYEMTKQNQEIVNRLEELEVTVSK